MKIIWASRAIKELQKIYVFIEEDSPQNANLLIDEITNKVTALPLHPKRYNTDKYKKDNAGNYRAFEFKKVRLSYKIEKQSIRIVRIRHTKQYPKDY
jgi:plasmid stabilization system protein ParE